MKNALKVALRISEVRERLNHLSGLDDLTEEQSEEIGTLTTEYRALEAKGRAAAIADEVETLNPTEPEPEFRELVEDASLAEVFSAALEMRSTTGATKELQDELKMLPHSIPLDLLEVRTSGQTSAPATTGASQSPIIPYVFPDAAASFLNIPQPRVPVGDAVYTVLTSGATARTPAAGNPAASSAASFTATSLEPRRIQASVFYRREDAGRLAGMDEALRANLSESLADQLDQQVLNVLFSTLSNHAAGAAPTTYQQYVAQFGYARVDGRFASSVSQVRSLMGSPTYGHAASQFIAGADVGAVQRLMMDTGGVRVSDHVPIVAAGLQDGIVRLGARRDMVVPIWQNVELIVDPYTQSADGEIKLTSVMLFSTALLRAAGFWRQQARIST